MEKQLLARGLVVGALGGLLAFVFGRVFAEPVIGRAIDYESGRDAAEDALAQAAGHPAADMDPEVFTRSVQSNIGIGVGMVLFGVAMGLLFAVAYSLLVGRIRTVAPQRLALLLAAGMFVGLYFVPFLKYPANPPSIGHPDTIGTRTALYLTMVVCSIVLLAAAVWLGTRLAPRLGRGTAIAVAAAAFVVAIAVVMLLLPSLGELSANTAEYGDFATETPQPLRDSAGAIVYPGFPADDLYAFRLYSVGAQAILWTTIACCFAATTRRLFPPSNTAVSASAG